MNGWQLVAVIIGISFSISAVLKQILPTRKMRPGCKELFCEMKSKIKQLDSRTDEIEKTMEVVKTSLPRMEKSLETLNKNVWSLVTEKKDN